MKKIFIAVMGLMLALGSTAQSFIHGSIQKAVENHTVDILFRPTYTSAGGEYTQYVLFAVSLPVGVAGPVTASLTPFGPFAGLTFVAYPPYTEPSTGEKIYTWQSIQSSAIAMSWTSNTEFIGAKVTFNGAPGVSSQVRMVDYTNNGGGGNGNTYFAVVTSVALDVTDYAALYYSKPAVSTLGNYGNGDQFVTTDPPVTLPIDLLSFSGYKDGAQNQLRWTTSTEQNNKGFEVQRSLDGVNYNAIGFVNSLANGGNSSNQLNYAFTDNNVTGARQFYRLRQVDIGGNSKVSKVVLIKGDKPAIISISGMFPNPAATTVNILVSAPGKDKVTLVITDLSGKTVMLRSLNVEVGSNTLPVDVSALASGTYIVKMTGSDGEASTAKLIKQ